MIQTTAAIAEAIVVMMIVTRVMASGQRLAARLTSNVTAMAGIIAIQLSKTKPITPQSEAQAPPAASCARNLRCIKLAISHPPASGTARKVAASAHGMCALAATKLALTRPSTPVVNGVALRPRTTHRTEYATSPAAKGHRRNAAAKTAWWLEVSARHHYCDMHMFGQSSHA